MREHEIDNDNTSKPAPDSAKPKGTRKAGKKAKPAYLLRSSARHGAPRFFSFCRKRSASISTSCGSRSILSRSWRSRPK